MSAPTSEQPAGGGGTAPHTFRRERVRFSEFSFIRTPSGHCTADVELEYEGQKVAGRSSGQSSPLADLRIAAEAALRALEQFTDNSLVFELIGVKLIRAFDANLVIVSVALRGSDAQARLVGCYLAESDTRRGAAVAVLNATNRILGNYISTR